MNKMRAPFQILALPYKIVDGNPIFCVFHRSDFNQWQFIAGGGEDDETPLQAAKREILEESGVVAKNIIELKSLCHIPTDIFPQRTSYGWPEDTYVIPEYCFAFECNDEITLSHEHTEYAWLSYEKSKSKLKWDSNRVALYELKCILNSKK